MKIANTLSVHINKGNDAIEAVEVRDLYKVGKEVSDGPVTTIVSIVSGQQEVNIFYEDVKDLVELHDKIEQYLDAKGVGKNGRLS
jgi:hypothetical protein